MLYEFVTEQMTDRRSLDRYALPSQVIISPNDDLSIIGNVIDMSLDGLGFEYVNLEHGELQGCLTIDIVYRPARFVLKNLPCIVVYDFQLPRTSPRFGFSKHRCGLEFVELSSFEEKQLENLLTYCRALLS